MINPSFVMDSYSSYRGIFAWSTIFTWWVSLDRPFCGRACESLYIRIYSRARPTLIPYLSQLHILSFRCCRFLHRCQAVLPCCTSLVNLLFRWVFLHVYFFLALYFYSITSCTFFIPSVSNFSLPLQVFIVYEFKFRKRQPIFWKSKTIRYFQGVR